MELEDLTIRQVKELQNGLGKRKQKEILTGLYRIVILQRGWVVVGRYFQKGSDCWLEDCAVIRAWGTTKGLGELAEKGPIPNKTVLDKCPVIRFHEMVIVAIIDCEQSKWQNKI